MRERVPLSPEIMPDVLKMLLLELSLEEQADRGQLGTPRLQGTGHTLKHRATHCTHDSHPGSIRHILPLPGWIQVHRNTQVQRSSLAKMQTSHLGACLWAMSVSTYHTQPFRAATVEPNRAVWVARAMERREGELGCIRGCSD